MCRSCQEEKTSVMTSKKRLLFNDLRFYKENPRAISYHLHVSVSTLKETLILEKDSKTNSHLSSVPAVWVE